MLVSGSGRSLRNLLELRREGQLHADIALVISSKAGVKALDHAAAFDVPFVVCKTREVTRSLENAHIDFVVMAGYLRKWPIPEEWVGRTINIHPSLLPLFGGPGFYGHHVHEAVLASGMRVSGCTVHFVTQNYDEGPIIDQSAVPVLPSDDPDTLAARVFEAELRLLPRCIDLLTQGRIVYDAGGVVHRE